MLVICEILAGYSITLSMEVFCIFIVLNSNSKVRLGKRIPRPDMYNQRTTLSVTTEVFMLPQFGKVKSKTIRNIKKTQNKLHILYKQFHFTVQREAFEETVEEKNLCINCVCTIYIA